jgi:hypothetical protein
MYSMAQNVVMKTYNDTFQLVHSLLYELWNSRNKICLEVENNQQAENVNK